MVTCQSSELDWEVTVELPADFLSLGMGSVKAEASNKTLLIALKKRLDSAKGKWAEELPGVL